MSNTITVTTNQVLINSGGVETLYSSAGGSVISTYTPTASDVISVATGATVSNITVGAGGRLLVLGGGTAIGTNVLSGGVLSAANSSLESATTVYSGGIFYIPTAGETISTGVGNPGVTVYSGAQIVVNGQTFNSSVSVNETSGGLLTVTSGTRTESMQLAGATTYTTAAGAAPYAGKTVITITCYAGDTEILTERGPVRIDTIQPKDNVVVRRDGQDVLEPVTWIGKSRIDLSRHVHPELAAPIRIKAGALSANIPARDLVVSPEHCLILEGRCVQAKLLVNGGSIAREYPTAPFEYYHIELARHGILIAEGAEAESYLDTGNRSMFDNADEPRLLHPAFEVNANAERWKTEACAPLATSTEEISPIWQALADRSAALGFVAPTPTTVDDPDLHIVVDGKRIQAISTEDSRYVFTVPASAKSVTLASRYFIPADQLVATNRDQRRLGVRVDRITIRTASAETILLADHPTLQDGWHDLEHAGTETWRWTDGAAAIPLAITGEAAVLTVSCAPAGSYPVQQETAQLAA